MDKAFEECGVSPVELAQARRYGMSIDWSQEDEAFLVSFPDVPGVMTHGATREEAAERGEEVIVMWLTAMIDAGRPVPPPSPYSSSMTIERTPTFNANRIREIRRGFDVSQRVFADLLNVSLATIRSWEQGVRTPDGAAMRLLNIAERHPATLMEAAASSDTSPDRQAARASRVA